MHLVAMFNSLSVSCIVVSAKHMGNLFFFTFSYHFHDKSVYIIVFLVSARNCSEPGQPDNGSTVENGCSIGKAVYHTCNVGLTLVGANRRVCQANGEWSESLPSCVGKVPR